MAAASTNEAVDGGCDHLRAPPKKVTQETSTRSYSAIVQNKSPLSKHDVQVTMVDGAPTVQVPSEIFSDATPLWEDLVVGRFPTAAPHIAKIHIIVNKIWTLGDRTAKIDAFIVNDSTIKFRIKDREMRERVLRRGMWSIADKPMFVSKWSPILEEAQPVIRTMPIWTVVKNIPQNMFTRKGISFLSSAVGEPLKLHPETELCNKFDEARVLVEVDLSKELPSIFRFTSDMGVDAVVEFKYPWFPPRCLICKKWGHLKETCRHNKPELVEGPAENSGIEAKETQRSAELTVNVKPVPKMTQEAGMITPVLQDKPQRDGKQIITDVSISEPVMEISTIQNSDKEWESVSPPKKKQGSQSKPRDMTISISPSRYSVLAEEEENDAEITVNTENIESSKEEGEIVEGFHKLAPVIRDNNAGLKDQGLRPTIPRSTKSIYKGKSDSVAHNTAPSVSGKRVPKKKN